MITRQGKVGQSIYIVLAVVVACGFGALPAVSGAMSNRGFERRTASAADSTSEARITVPGTHGYRVEIRVSGNDAQLVASKGHSAALYTTERSTIRHGVFHARFGRLGTVRLSFTASLAKDRSRNETCRTDSVQQGQFYGLLVFKGENNFTRLKREVAHGTVRTLENGNPRSHCRQGGSNREPVTQSATPRLQYELRSVTFTHDGFVQFFAGPRAIGEVRGWERNVGIPLGLPPLEKGSQGLAALAFEARTEARMRVVRLAASAGPKTSFATDHAKLLSIAAPSPFAGTGQIELCPPSILRGSLKVLFPGRVMSLTGQRWGSVISPIPSAC